MLLQPKYLGTHRLPGLIGPREGKGFAEDQVFCALFDPDIWLNDLVDLCYIRSIPSGGRRLHVEIMLNPKCESQHRLYDFGARP